MYNFQLIDEGYGSLVIEYNKGNLRTYDKDCMLVCSCRSRRDAIKYACKYLLEIVNKRESLYGIPLGIEDRSWKAQR